MTSTQHNFTSQGANLTPEDVARVARGDTVVSLSADAAEAVRRSRAIVDGIVERGEVVYGITTGFGAFKDKVIPPGALAELQVNLILSHCVGVGPDLPVEVVRAMMLCRAHTLSLGYSGIRLDTLQLLYSMLNAGVHPRVPEQGSVGSSGDLAPLAHLALAMIGGGECYYGARVVSTAEALDEAGLAPCVFGPKEGLAITNGTSLMAALLSLAVVDGGMLCDTADVVGSMTLEALQATPAAFDPRIHAARPYQGQTQVATNVRALTEGSTLLWNAERATRDERRKMQDEGREASEGGGRRTMKVQDAYSLRCIPQVHGAARDTLRHVRSVLVTELNSANDNPLVFGGGEGDGLEPGQEGATAVISGGNFHGAPLSVAADFLSIGLCQLANISERRQARMLDKSANDGLLPPFLTEYGGVNSGFMMLQYTAAALASENKSLAHPASVDTIPTSAGWEDLNSMGPIAARHARSIAANTARILALEALIAAQAIDFRLRRGESGTEARLGRGTRTAYEAIRARIPFIERDEDMRPHIAAAEEVILSGDLARPLWGNSKF